MFSCIGSAGWLCAWGEHHWCMGGMVRPRAFANVLGFIFSPPDWFPKLTPGSL